MDQQVQIIFIILAVFIFVTLVVIAAWLIVNKITEPKEFKNYKSEKAKIETLHNIDKQTFTIRDYAVFSHEELTKINEKLTKLIELMEAQN